MSSSLPITITSLDATPSAQPHPIDPVAFQASLDDSVNSIRNLVASWIPKNLGAEWNAENTGGTANQSVESLNARARPARLGLGANPGVAHQQLAEERKLRNQLAGPSANKRRMAEAIEEAEFQKRREAKRAKKEQEGSSDEEEESRSSVFAASKIKANGVNGLGGDKKQKAEDVELSKTSKKVASGNGTAPSSPFSTPAKPLASTSKLLFDLATPLLAPVPSSATSTPTSALSNKPNGNHQSAPKPNPMTNGAADGGVPLTKNQKKKKRQQEKLAALQKASYEAMRAEEAGLMNGVSSSSVPAETESTPPQDEASSAETITTPVLKTRFPKPPFAPLTSSSESEPNMSLANGMNGIESEDDSDGDDGQTESTKGSINGSFISNGHTNGSEIPKKKRKKRNKKKKNQQGAGDTGDGDGALVAKNLLNI